MFGVDSTELFIVAVAALLFIGPKELPSAMRTVGRFVGRIRAHARHFTAGIENMMREAELEEMEKKWREENERIMRSYPDAPHYHAVGYDVPDQSPSALDGSAERDEADRYLMTDTNEADEPRLPLGEPDTSHRPLP